MQLIVWYKAQCQSNHKSSSLTAKENFPSQKNEKKQQQNCSSIKNLSINTRVAALFLEIINRIAHFHNLLQYLPISLFVLHSTQFNYIVIPHLCTSTILFYVMNRHSWGRRRRRRTIIIINLHRREILVSGPPPLRSITGSKPITYCIVVLAIPSAHLTPLLQQ